MDEISVIIPNVWAGIDMAMRLKILRCARQAIADRADEFADSVSLPGRRSPVETLPMEVLPLLDAIRFLERSAAKLLATRRLGRKGRPLWLSGVSAEIRREALGRVLIIAPFNYPLFLPGVQVVQALTAGNTVLVKPSPGHSAPMQLLRQALVNAGMPESAFEILLESASSAQEAIAAGVDKIVLTGSVETGRKVLEQAVQHVTPSVMELSGNDAVFILPGADRAHVAKALSYGLQLNGGATCIAPRRVYLPEAMIAPLVNALTAETATYYPIGGGTVVQLKRLLAEARHEGATILGGVMDEGEFSVTPTLIIRPSANSNILKADIFAPILALIPVESLDAAILQSSACPYALGAAIFGPEVEARKIADRLDVGTVVINDLIVPTADPRVPFEGRHYSGFGATRGGEGLLAMTRLKVVTIRKGNGQWHLTTPKIADAQLFLSFIRVLHCRGLPALIRQAWALAAAIVKRRM